MQRGTKKSVGRPKKYGEKIKILHSIEKDLLKKVDAIANKDFPRTAIINEAIVQYVKKVGNGIVPGL